MAQDIYVSLRSIADAVVLTIVGQQQLERERKKTVLGVESRQDVIKVAIAIVLGWELVCAPPLTVHDELEQLSDQKKEKTGQEECSWLDQVDHSARRGKVHTFFCERSRSITISDRSWLPWTFLKTIDSMNDNEEELQNKDGLA